MPNPTLMQAVLALINAESEAERKRVLENERDVLLTDDAEQLLNAWLAQSASDYARTLQERLGLLARCRKEGISGAFAEPVRPLGTPNDLDALLAEIRRLTNRQDMPRRVELCQAALELVSWETQSFRWAWLQVELGISLSENPLGDHADNLEQAIKHFQQSLEVYTRQAFPYEWARSINNLANAYNFRIRGERADNLEQAIGYYEQSLEVYTRQAFPFEWAQSCNNLALAYLYRIQGERADNLERAIEYYEQSLEAYTRQAFPYEWASSINNLAGAYWNRIRGKRTNNLERAIEYYKQSQEVWTRQAFPEQWATSMNNLANAYNHRIKGERADNIERAISLSKQSLEVYTRQAFPYEWARSINNLALTYHNRIKGERADNLELAIDYYQQAQEVHTRQAFPYEWARNMNSLAAAYHKCIKGERADNLELAIDYYQQAQEVHTRQAFPYEWATSINNLANVYSDRIKGERADNLELAIDYYQQAQEVWMRQAFPEQWATSMNNLANAYNFRIRGARADNLERAIEYYEQSLEVYTRQAFPEQWARSINNLANAYSDRIRGERADNLERAIEYYEQSLEVYTRQAFPYEWAQSYNNLAEAYRERIRGARADNLEQAIEYYEQLLEVYTRQAFPLEWARSINNLANAYLYRIRGERADNLELAIDYYEQLLEVYTRQAFPLEWATSINNLANAYNFRIKGGRADNLERAIDYFQQSLEVRTPQSLPQDCRNTAYGLGRLFYNEKRFAEAREALMMAHKAVEALRGEMVREGARRRLADENADLYARLVACCLHDGDEEAAFEYVVAGKGRVFADLLASTRFDLSAAEDDDPAFTADWQTHREFRQQIDNLLVQLTEDKGIIGTSGGPTGSESRENERWPKKLLHDQLRATQEKAAEHWEDMTFRYPALTACESAPTLTAQDARNLSAELGATLVEYYRHAAGWCAFVVTPDEVRYVALPAVDELIELMRKWTKRIEKRIGRNKASYRRLLKWYEAVIAPLNLPKGEGKAVVLAPFGALHLLPLTAARHPQSQQYVSEEHTLAFAPSLGALSVAVKESRKGQSLPASWKQALLVAYPGLPEWKDHSDKEVRRKYLHNVLPEATAIAQHFPQPTPLHKEAATPDEVLKEARGKEVIHFGCHGSFDSQQPEQSGLMLADGWLTVQRIITDLRLKQCQLTTLGACQSGRTALGSGDEHVGLIQALMTAGTPSVVASLWNVNDIATRALFEAFYAEITKGQPPAIALCQAAEQVRKRSGWEHPYYWGAFAVSGLAHGPIRPALPQVIEQAAAPNVVKPLDTINQEPQPVRGTINMNEKDIYNDAIELLEQISEDADYFAEQIGPTDGAIVINQLTVLWRQAASIENQSQLLTLCDAIHKFVEEMPILRNLLILEDSSDVSQMQNERAVYLEDIEYAATEQQSDKKALDTIRQHLVETRQKLEQHLSKLEQQQSQPPSRSES